MLYITSLGFICNRNFIPFSHVHSACPPPWASGNQQFVLHLWVQWVFFNYTYKWDGDCLVVQTVKSLPAMQETQVQSLSWDDPWRKKWHPTPVFLPEESHGQSSLAGYSPRGCKQLDTTEWLSLIHSSHQQPALGPQSFHVPTFWDAIMTSSLSNPPKTSLSPGLPASSCDSLRK